ncbi:MAG TPA: hypothetical protein VEL76_01490 [Gemmataceae bacterium]|nr:hypothetical protein [Gemmataceae bacterium]
MAKWVFMLGVGLLLITMGFLMTAAILGPRPRRAARRQPAGKALPAG